MKSVQQLLFLFSCMVMQYQYAHEINEDIYERENYFDFFAQSTPLQSIEKIKDLNEAQTKIAQQNEKEYARFQVLNHGLFSTEKIRFFNFTAFDQYEFKNKLDIGQFNLSDLDQLHITFGYGVEYLYKDGKAIGYEFLSAFPYDRGRLIRIYWNQTF